MSKELEMLREWCDETLNWRNAHITDLRAILRRLEAAERVTLAAEAMKEMVEGKEDWGEMNAALRAYRALDGEETQCPHSE